jgi:radical SAM superfamily enzyme YgiQ (UPF0313 family)
MNIKIIEPYYLNKRFDIKSLTPNLGPVIVASLLKQKGHKVEVISEYISKLNFEEINKADLVGISITTYNATKGYEIAQRIKKPIVFGGFHASLMPEEGLNCGDYVIRGDGHPIVELADFLSKKRTKDISQIPNLVYKKGDKVLYNQTETKPLNIVPDFSLVKDYYKLNLNRLFRIPLLVNASRGCHYDCSFCAINEIYKDFAQKDKEIVVKDIKAQIENQHFLSRFLPRIIWITDDNFFSDKTWAKDVLRELARLKTNYKFNIQARPDIVYDDELLELMRKANIGFVSLGIESLSQKSLDNFNKEFSLEDIKYAVEKIRSYGIAVHGLFVFGDDEFRKGDGLRVAEFAKQNKLSGVLVQPLTPFPGTKLFRKLKMEGRILHNHWEDYNGKVVFKPKELTAAELQKEVYNCYRRVYSPLQVIKFLLFGKKGFKLIILGIAKLRYLEWLRNKNYIKDKLSN